MCLFLFKFWGFSLYLYNKDNFILATFSAVRIIMTISHTICLSTARRQIGLIINKLIGFSFWHKEDLGGIHYHRPVLRPISSVIGPDLPLLLSMVQCSNKRLF